MQIQMASKILALVIIRTYVQTQHKLNSASVIISYYKSCDCEFNTHQDQAIGKTWIYEIPVRNPGRAF